MLKSNLKVLLAERNISITQVSNDTGISRTTLTSLMSVAKGIQFETMNTLCNYLKITPSDLFIYVPYDIEIELKDFKYKQDSIKYMTFFIKVFKGGRKYEFSFNGFIYNVDKDFDIDIDLEKTPETPEEKESVETIKNSLEKLPIQFAGDIEKQVKAIFLKELEYSDFYDKINEEIPFIDDKIKGEDLYIKFDWIFLNK